MPLTPQDKSEILQVIVKAAEEAKAILEISNCEDGCCPSYAKFIDAKRFIQLLEQEIERYDI